MKKRAFLSGMQVKQRKVRVSDSDDKPVTWKPQFGPNPKLYSGRIKIQNSDDKPITWKLAKGSKKVVQEVDQKT